MKSQDSFTPRLVVIEGNDKGKVILLKDGTLVIGRSKGDILIQDPRISRSHVALHFEAKTGRLSFTDLKSLNGVIHNSANQVSGEIVDGDKLQLGNTVFDCQIAREGSDATVNAIHPSKVFVEPAIHSTDQPHLEQKEPEESLQPESLSSEKEPFFITKWKGISKRSKSLALGVLILGSLFWGLHQNQPKFDLKSELSLARELAGQGKIEQAILKAEEISKRYDETSESFMLLGDVYAKQGKIEQALVNYRKAHDLPPAQVMVHLRLIRLFLKGRLIKEAEIELQHIDEIFRKEGPPSKELFIETAEIFLEFKEFKQPPEKLFILAKALQNIIAPDNKIGFKLEAQSYLQQNRNQEALEILTQINKMDPKDEWVYENMSFCKLSLNDALGALVVVENWLSYWPNSTKALLVMAYLKFNDNKLAEVEPLVRKVIELLKERPTDPHYAESLHLLGQICLRTDRGEEATGFFKQACALGFTQSCTAPNDVAAGALKNESPSPPTVVNP